jgi:MHS family proline/betaine transporter-like MFS transporter
MTKRSAPALAAPVDAGAPADTVGGIDPATRRRVIAASFVGNFVEWFDYAVYGYLAATIATVFFPDSDRTTGLLLTFAVFAISFFVRPLGGLVWGSLGDRLGRRTALSYSILVMSAATFCIALLPSYAAVGLLSPVLLLVVRVVQGFSASGEYAGASSFLVEYAPRGRRGIYAAVVPASTAAGLLFGSLIAAGLTGLLSDPQMHSFGWRLPFLLAAPMGLVGRYIRYRLEDTPAFLALEQDDEVARTPALEMFRVHRKALLLALGAALLNAVAFYVLLSYMPTYLSEELGFGQTESFLATTVSLATYIGFIFLTGLASDRVGRRTMLLAASVMFVVFTVPAFALLDRAGFLAEIFPTKVRYSGFAVSFNVANAVFGGTAPFVATLLISSTGSHIAPAWYLVAAAAVSGLAVLMSPETSRDPLRES